MDQYVLVCRLNILYSENIYSGYGVFTDFEHLRIAFLKIFVQANDNNIWGLNKKIEKHYRKHYKIDSYLAGYVVTIENIWKTKINKSLNIPINTLLDKKFPPVSGEYLGGAHIYRTIVRTIANKELYDRYSVKKNKKLIDNYEYAFSSSDEDFFWCIDGLTSPEPIDVFKNKFLENDLVIFGNEKDIKYKRKFPSLTFPDNPEIYETPDNEKYINTVGEKWFYSTELFNNEITMFGSHKYDYKYNNNVIVPYLKYKKCGRHWERMYYYFDVSQKFIWYYVRDIDSDDMEKQSSYKSPDILYIETKILPNGTKNNIIYDDVNKCKHKSENYKKIKLNEMYFYDDW